MANKYGQFSKVTDADRAKAQAIPSPASGRTHSSPIEALRMTLRMMEQDSMDWPARRKVFFNLDPRFQKEFVRYLLQLGRSGWVRSLSRPLTTIGRSTSPSAIADRLLELPSTSLQREKLRLIPIKTRKKVRHNIVQRANGSNAAEKIIFGNRDAKNKATKRNIRKRG